MEQEQDIFEAAPIKKISKILDFSLRSAIQFEFHGMSTFLFGFLEIFLFLHYILPFCKAMCWIRAMAIPQTNASLKEFYTVAKLLIWMMAILENGARFRGSTTTSQLAT